MLVNQSRSDKEERMTIMSNLSADQKHTICLDILHSLSSWFGNKAAVLDYAQQCRTLPVFAAFLEEEAIGFVALKSHNEFTSEICVMGVKPTHHGQGVGRALLVACEEICHANGTRYLTVKTLADTHPSKSYAKTRAFYRAVGFLPLEIFPLYWDKDSPCLVMAKYLG